MGKAYDDDDDGGLYSVWDKYVQVFKIVGKKEWWFWKFQKLNYVERNELKRSVMYFVWRENAFKVKW